MRKQVVEVKAVNRGMKQMNDLVKITRAVMKDIVLSEMNLYTVQDVQAVIFKASGIVAGLKWKNGVKLMMNNVSRNEAVLSVCPIKDVNSLKDMLILLTSKKVILTDGVEVFCVNYEDIEAYIERNGLVSSFMEIELRNHYFSFEWCSKNLGKFTHDLLVKKVNQSHFGFNLSSMWSA